MGIQANDNVGSTVGVTNGASGPGVTDIQANGNLNSGVTINNGLGRQARGFHYDPRFHYEPRFPSTSITADGNLWSTVDVTNNPGSYPWNVDISADGNFGSDVGVHNTGSGTISADRNTGSTVRINNHGRRRLSFWDWNTGNPNTGNWNT